jgi:hypothetical protein
LSEERGEWSFTDGNGWARMRCEGRLIISSLPDRGFGSAAGPRASGTVEAAVAVQFNRITVRPVINVVASGAAFRAGPNSEGFDATQNCLSLATRLDQDGRQEPKAKQIVLPVQRATSRGSAAGRWD